MNCMSCMDHRLQVLHWVQVKICMSEMTALEGSLSPATSLSCAQALQGFAFTVAPF